MCEQRFMELPLLESHILNVHLKNKSSTNNSNCKTESNNEDLRQNITINSDGQIQPKIKRELESDHPILDTNSKNHQEKYVIEKRLKTLLKNPGLRTRGFRLGS